MLGFSRLIWGRFVLHQDMQTVLRCHMEAFAAIGGVPNEILYDRMKTAVIGEAGGSIVYNRALVDFARHYGYQPKACRPYRAKTKGKVERPYRYIREDFFLARSFRNLDDLNAQLGYWLDSVANPRVHATTQRVVNEAFAEEKPHLKTLPLATCAPSAMPNMPSISAPPATLNGAAIIWSADARLIRKLDQQGRRAPRGPPPWTVDEAEPAILRWGLVDDGPASLRLRTKFLT